MNLILLLKTKLRQLVPGKADEPREAPEEALDTPPDPALDQGMPVEVMRDFDAVLLFGRLTAVRRTALIIGRIPGEDHFPVCQPGSPVLVRGYDARMDPILLLGSVEYSSGMRCVVGDLKRIPYETQRKSVRYPLTPPASVCVMDGAAPGEPQPCQLLNIGEGGACIVTEYSYRMGQALRLQVELAGHTAAYPCRVVRETPRSGGMSEYGLLFTRMDQTSRGGLMRDIEAIRTKTEKKLRL